tara:strand:+ start:3202 stop:5247 length:2046 start_codon:yes stop_codon:yes gene_type:complete
MANSQDIDALWKDLINDPDKIYQDKTIDNETLIKLQKKINPYSYQKEIEEVTEEDPIQKVALVSYTNLDEDYQRRFLMTSLIGFIYRMYNEYNLEPDALKYDTLAYTNDKFKDVEIHGMYTLEKLEGYIVNIEKYVRENRIKTDEHDEQAALIKRMQDAGKDFPEEQLEEFRNNHEKKMMTIDYILNHILNEMGEDAKRRMDTITNNCNSHDILHLTIEDAKEVSTKARQLVSDYRSVQHDAELLKNKILSIELSEGDDKVTSEDRVLIKKYEQDLLLLNYKLTLFFTNVGEDAKYRKAGTVKYCSKYNDILDTIRESGYNPKEVDTLQAIPEPFIKSHIGKFLDKYFEYNPDEHVRSSFDDEKLSKDARYDQHDPSRPTMKLLKARSEIEDGDIKDVLADRETYNAAMFLLNKNPELLKKLAADPDGFKEKLTPIREAHELIEKIPPADTFHRWNYYAEVNMEEIRNVVSTVYHEKPLLDFALIVYDTIEGTESEVKEKKRKWISKYNEELCSDLKVVKLDNWTLLGNFKENRKEIDFYNRHTEVLKRIMDKHEEDKKLGGDLMKKRVRKTKEKNIKEQGRDADIMKQYVSQVQSLTDLGAKRVLSYEEQRQIVDAKKIINDLKDVEDVPDNAIQVDVFTHNTGNEKFVKSSFYTESELPMDHDEVEKHIALSKGLDPNK